MAVTVTTTIEITSSLGHPVCVITETARVRDGGGDREDTVHAERGLVETGERALDMLAARSGDIRDLDPARRDEFRILTVPAAEHEARAQL